jgi:hypothetical protein
MFHGQLSKIQQEALKPYILGKKVHDLGAGGFELTHKLIDLGAEGVIAIDRYSPFPSPSFFDLAPNQGKIQFVQSYFHDYHEPIQTAFCSWPVNWQSGLDHIAARTETFIYLGSNTDGSMCGYQDMWQHLRTREILAHLPERKNTLIVYGPKTVDRPEVPEERAALNLDKMWSYGALHEKDSIASAS